MYILNQFRTSRQSGKDTHERGHLDLLQKGSRSVASMLEVRDSILSGVNGNVSFT